MGINLNELEQEYNELNSLETLNQDQQDRKNWLENKIGEFKATQQEREQEHEQRVNESLTATDQLLEQIDLKKYIGEGPDAGILAIRIKRAFMAQAENFNNQSKVANDKFNDQLRAGQDRENQLQRQYNQLQSDYETLEEKNRQLEFASIESDRKRDAAVQQADEFKAQVKQLESWNQDLREQIAFGVKGSLTIIDDEETKRQEAALEAQLKRERTIYNKEWANPIKKDKFKAHKAIDGEYFEFPWTEETKYFVIEESEVQQFREQYGVQSTDQIPSVVEASIPNGVNQEATFPSAAGVEFVHAPDLSTGNISGESTHEQVAQKTDGERITELERRVDILFQNQNIGQKSEVA